MKTTDYLELVLPDFENTANIEDINSNMNKIDLFVKELSDRVVEMEESGAQQEEIEKIKDRINILEEAKATLDAKIDTHINNKENPHRVTKHQIGLNKVDNTADIDKPVSKPTEERLKDFWGKEELEIGGRNLIVKSKLIKDEALDSNSQGADINLNVTNGSRTDYITINDKYANLTVSRKHGTVNDYNNTTILDWLKISFYDKDKAVVGFVQYQVLEKVEPPITIPIPKGTKFARFSASRNDLDRLKVEYGNIATDWTPAPEDIQAQIDEVIQSVEGIPEVFHDLPQNAVKEEMTPGEFEYGVTLCSQSLITDFPSINEYGVSYTIIGKHSNYVQLFITRFGDIWSRRSSARSSWNGEWYNSKTEIEKKVDKVSGKGLSTNDFTNANKKSLETDIPNKIDILNKEKADIKDLSRSSTIVIANYDSHANSKKAADIVIKEGENAAVKINQAIQSLEGISGEIKLMEGKYNLEYGLAVNVDGVHLTGIPGATVLVQSSNWKGNPSINNRLHIIDTWREESLELVNVVISHIIIDGKSLKSSRGFNCLGKSTITNCISNNTGNYGFYCTNSSQVTNCTSNKSNGIGFSCTNSSQVTNCTSNNSTEYGFKCLSAFKGVCSFNILRGDKLSDESLTSAKVEYNIVQEV